MSQQVVNIFISAGAIVLAAGILAAIRGLFKFTKAVRENTEQVAKFGGQLTEYIHKNDTDMALVKADVQDLKDWRLQSGGTPHPAR